MKEKQKFYTYEIAREFYELVAGVVFTERIVLALKLVFLPRATAEQFELKAHRIMKKGE